MDAASEVASESRVTGSGDGDWEVSSSTLRGAPPVPQHPAGDWEATSRLFGELDWGRAPSAALHDAGAHLRHPAGEWALAGGILQGLVPPEEMDHALSPRSKQNVTSALEKAHARFLLGQLLDLGFPEWQCRAAVALYGRCGAPSRYPGLCA